MARREGSALVWQKTDERLKEAVLEAFEIAPLPNPPLELPDFLAIPLPLLSHWFGRRRESSQSTVKDSICD